MSFYNDPTGELICGDLIINMVMRKNAALNRFYQDRRRMTDSFQYLLGNTRPLKIYPGHGAVIEDDENALRSVTGF